MRPDFLDRALIIDFPYVKPEEPRTRGNFRPNLKSLDHESPAHCSMPSRWGINAEAFRLVYVVPLRRSDLDRACVPDEIHARHQDT
jgi:hypothetical protein